MTKDEAIELLEDLDGAIEDNHGRDYDEAFRMAPRWSWWWGYSPLGESEGASVFSLRYQFRHRIRLLNQ